MALNISFDGYVHDKDTTLCSGVVYYQGLFAPAGTASSPLTWSDRRTIESSGYYSINLGDSTFLNQDGVALDGSVVIISFWSGTPNRSDDCSLIEEWGSVYIVLDGSSVYTNSVQIKDNIFPNLSWSNDLGAHPFAHDPYHFTNNSDDEHTWDFNGVMMHHFYTVFGETFFNINRVRETSYNWGDGNTDNDLPGASDGFHTWSSAGEYTISIEIEDECDAIRTDSLTRRVYWKPPIPAISRCDSSGNILSDTIQDPDTPIYFRYSGTNNDNVIVNISWEINDSGPYGNTNSTAVGLVNDVIPHSNGQGTDWLGHSPTPGAFTNPGNHTITMTITWFDGFDNQTLVYSDTFRQRRFNGPSVNFSQSPVQAQLGENVTFTNTTTNTSRVGLGLPDGDLYFWNWHDGLINLSDEDVPHAHQFVQTPVTSSCYVELCAHWSDGWENQVTCTTKDVVFDTSISVTPQECYYLLDIVGTSTNGTTTGYGWTIASGTTASGVYTDIWSSPIGMDQKQKTVCFSAVGWYKITGTVYGTGSPTSDFETLYVSDACPGGGDKTLPIWDGTGVLDIKTDWERTGFGFESPISKYEGTNGLEVTSASGIDFLHFNSLMHMPVSLDEYDFLSFWINLRQWVKGSDIEVNMFLSTNPVSTPLNLSYYLHFGFMERWQRVMIPLARFELPKVEIGGGSYTYIDTLEFRSLEGVDFWLDNVVLSTGEIVTYSLDGTDQRTFGLDTEADVKAMLAYTEKLPKPTQSGQPDLNKGMLSPSMGSKKKKGNIPRGRFGSRPTVNPFPDPKKYK